MLFSLKEWHRGRSPTGRPRQRITLVLRSSETIAVVLRSKRRQMVSMVRKAQKRDTYGFTTWLGAAPVAGLVIVQLDVFMGTLSGGDGFNVVYNWYPCDLIPAFASRLIKSENFIFAIAVIPVA